MFDKLPAPAALEDDVLALWQDRDVFRKSMEQAEDRPDFVFFEGPPTANGLPHNGHVLTRVVKDVIPRFMTMKGRRVRRKAGWDTHGLPVEIEVQKRLGLKGRAGIEEMGIEAFNTACRESVFTYVEEWNTLTKQIGFWVDLDDPYVTFHRSYVESVWWALAELFDKGLLYQGHKVVWWWPQGGTTLSAAEVGQGYKEVLDPAITVRFRDAEDPSTSYLAWTTTPWTLPSNVALAVGEDIVYARCDDPEGGTVIVAKDLAEAHELEIREEIPASELVGRRYTPVFDFGPVVPLAGGRGDSTDAYRIITAEHVTTSAGTGIVHTAPAFGEDDMKAAQQAGLGMHQWIRPDGTFGPEAGEFAGMFCKDADKPIIRDLKERGLLFKRDQYRHDYPFSYRADDEPLIQYARPTWFIRTTSAIDKIIENNKEIGWTPEHIKEGRFGDFLRNNVDWALSRERFWGTPLNIWVCEAEGCECMKAPRSMAQLREWGAVGFDETVDEHLQIHKPWVDGITLDCPECGATMRRVPEVIDCWFDSGCMPFAQWGFPHQNHETFKREFPADWISEAIDQTRGWFYSLLAISTLLFDDEVCERYDLTKPDLPHPYRNCVVLGLILDMDGIKESKSKGNYTSPNLVLRGTTKLSVLPDDTLERGTVGLKAAQVRSLDLGKQKVSLSAEKGGEPALPARVVQSEVGPKDTCHLHPDDIAELGCGDSVWFTVPGEAPGADAFRWLFCASNPVWSSTRLSLRAIREGQREFLIRLRNVYQFFAIYADIAREAGSFDPSGEAPRPRHERSELDRWILDRVDQTASVAGAELEAFHIYPAARAVLALVDDLSNWYVRRSRARFWGEGEPLQDALWTLYEALRTTARLIAPFVPFTAEALWQQLAVGARPDAADSVHLTLWPEPTGTVDEDLLADMALVRQLASLGLSARTASKVKVRQPLQAITVVLADPSRQAAVERLADLLHDELNVREIRFAEDAGTFVSFTVKPDYKKLGRKLGKDMKACARGLAAMDGAQAMAALESGGLEIALDEERSITLTDDEVVVQIEAKGAYEAASSSDAVVVLHTELTDDLRAEGLLRELTSKVQGARKQLDLGYTQRIDVTIDGSEAVADAVSRFGDYLQRESLATSLTVGAPGEDFEVLVVDVDEDPVTIGVRPH